MPEPFFEPLAPAQVRYIKLGAGGAWEAAALDGDRLEWGTDIDPHDLALAHNWDGARAAYVAHGLGPATTTSSVRELRDFYTLGADVLWITFARDHLWWAFAEPEVIYRGREGELGKATRYRRIIGSWRNTDIFGQPLAVTGLSTSLTKVASYRQTMCSVEAEAYLIRRLNGLNDPAATAARAAQGALRDATASLIRQLHQNDFELLVDLLFARTGWQRVSPLGGNMKDNDLIIEQPATGERASVQVKSAADQRVLEECIAAFTASPLSERFFFVCHTPKGSLTAPADSARPIHVWGINELARKAADNGLVEWLIGRAA